MLGFVLALAPTPLSPPTPPAEIQLTWQAPAECPDAQDVIERYQELLTTAPTGEGVMEAEAVIVADGDAWKLELITRMGDFTDVRKLRASRCAELGEAAAMLFAVALEPTLDESQPLPDDEEPDWSEYVELEEVVEETASSVVESPPAVEEVDAPVEKRPLFMTASAGVENGAVPGVTARAAVGLGYAWTWARVEGDLVWYAPRNEPGSFGPASIQVAGAAMRGCGVPGTGRWKFPVCLGFEAGATIARTNTGGGRQTVSGRWVAPLLRVATVFQGRRIGGFAAFEGAGPVFGTDIRVDDDTIFAPTIGSLRGIAGIEIYFF